MARLELSTRDWAEITDAARDVSANVTDVTFLVKSAAQATDPLYGEAQGAPTTFVTYATVKGSAYVSARGEYQTREGVYDGDDIKIWLPQGFIQDWELANPALVPFKPTEQMDVVFQGKRYNITGIMDEEWPLADAVGFARLGLAVFGQTRPK